VGLVRVMNIRSPIFPILISTAVGVTLWMIASVLTGKGEPWDSSSYWMIMYPLAIAGSALLGYRYPERPWRWPLVLFEAQFLAICVRNGELGNLWPLGMALFGVMALPGVFAAKLTSRLNAVANNTGSYQ